jgi:DNA-binding MarR family transcriptional regulator
MKLKKDLIDELSQSVQRSSALTVIHTNAIADKVGLSATEFEAIDLIANNQPISAGQLARFCGLTSGAITGLIDRLEKGGYVRRKGDPNDRRRVLIEHVHAPEIEQKVRELYRPIGAAFYNLINAYTAEQIKFLVDHTNEMNEKVESIIIDLKKQ